MYAYVKDGAIDRFGELPKVWQMSDGSTVSGFHLLDKFMILAEGWYEVIDERPDYDNLTQYLTNQTHTIQESSVVTRYEVVSYPEPEPELPQRATDFDLLEAQVLQNKFDIIMIQMGG